ncbi:hypothetical protein [Pedobacter terrae]|uniref:hypothetical protein n=1 Tax=Pedobacter terrae TaxID=405671 RepID=UPI002FF4FC1C
MSSIYLNNLNPAERTALIEKLWHIQNGKCFITNEQIDLQLHISDLDIDHVIPSKLDGKDDPSNFALTFSSANRSKQAADLNLARILHAFSKIQENLKKKEDRSPNLDDILKLQGGATDKIRFKLSDDKVSYSFSSLGRPEIITQDVYIDKLSGLKYFFAVFPIQYLHHDNVINPRAIGSNISKLVDEFYSGNPQLHISLGWVDIKSEEESEIKIFDGQHKAAAQILLNTLNIPVRVFINPDRDKLILTNFRAGTTLRQVAFDKSVQRHLGNTLYWDRVTRYQEELKLEKDNFNFSERQLVGYFKGESRELKRYILDSVRDAITRHPENKLIEFVDMGGRAKEKPLSYSTIEKTFYPFFIYQDLLDTPISYRLDEGKNPRSLETEQIVRLMSIIAEELFIGKFDLELGTFKIENRIQNGENLPADHVRAYRMVKEEILHNWLRFIGQIIQNHFISLGIPIDDKKLFQNEFSDVLWKIITNSIINLSNLPLWKNNSLAVSVFGGKQNYHYWHSIFTTGNSPQGVKVLPEPINLMKLQQ